MIQTPGKKVLLIGWDAADWKIINPLLDQGLMPTLENFVNHGVMGNIATLHPILSPMLWNSIATGKRPDKHGILGFIEPDPQSGGVRPTTSTSRKVKAIWNILTQRGYKTHVLGWFAGHPAEPINGISVSDLYPHSVAPLGKNWPLAPGAVYPESMRENYQFIKNMGITSVMDQIMTPYPKTPMRDEMIEADRVANLADFRWYDGYFSNVRTSHLTPAELNFVRWKIRREVIGMWRATPGDWKFFKGYTYLWEFGFRHIVWLNERLLELIFGIEGRYKLQMRQFLQLNDFGIEIPGRLRVETYHPIYGNSANPYEDTRWSMLKQRLPFPWRKRLGAPSKPAVEER